MVTVYVTSVFHISLFVLLGHVLISECGTNREWQGPGFPEVDKKVQIVFEGLLELVQNFTYVMDLPTDVEAFQQTVAAFAPMLHEYIAQTTSETRDQSLVLHSLLGAFRLRANAIKDALASRRLSEVKRAKFDDIAKWSLTLFKEVIVSGGFNVNVADKSMGMTPLEVAVKLQMIEAASLLLLNGATLCISVSPLECSDALHYAVINQDVQGVELLLNALMKEPSLSTNMICSYLMWKGRVSFSPLEIAYLHCQMGLSCTVSELFNSLRFNCDSYWQNILMDTLISHTPLSINTLSQCQCQSDTTKLQCGPENMYHWLPPTWAKTNHASKSSGWLTYRQFQVGRDGCDLPRVNVKDISVKDFETVFVNLSIPVVIEGAMDGWKLFEEWKRQTVERRYGQIDVLVGPIPYGEVFGEKFGYATIQQFLSYLDNYSVSPAIAEVSNPGEERAEFQPPLYVFDSQVLLAHFSHHYSLPALFAFRDSYKHYHQFILGPAGSGAPFHFHCHAANALVYGRKKWFLYPPGQAVYTKEHPLLWYREKYPTLHVKPTECLQGSGQVLYIPSGWSHTTINLDEGIGLAVEFDTKNC